VDNTVFAFGLFRLYPAERLLLREDKPVRVGSRALETLVALIEHAGETVLKDQLIDRVWPGTFVDESALRVHVAALRKALGDGQDGNRFIANVPGRGYSFVAPVTRAHQQATALPNQYTRVGNLPAQLVRAIGRDDVIAAATSRLSQRRLLTITGPGGIGKTTVAVAAAEAMSTSYPDGVWFVGLSTVIDAALVPGAVGATLGMLPSNVDPLTALAAWLREKHLLIVLDCCEHVVSAAAALADAVLRAAPEVCILATSREPLRADGEWLLRLPSLEVPSEAALLSADEALGYSAVELFNERAAASGEGFALSDTDVPDALEICRRLDGMPLALELAAAQVDVFGLKGLAAALEDRFAILTRGRRTALPRHQTLRATIDWSYDLLPPAEQAVLRRAAVFAGDFTLDMAGVVCAADGLTSADVFIAMANLVAKSLIAADISGVVPSYRLLETTRAYARDRLHESGALAEVARRHADFLVAVLAHVNEKRQSRPADEYLPAFRRYTDEVHAALEWAFSAAGDPVIGLTVTIAAVPLWFALFQMTVARVRLEQALQYAERGSDDEMRLRIAMGHALWYTHMGLDIDTLEQNFTRVLEIAEQIGAKDAQILALWGLWAARRGRRDYPAALEMARRFGNAAESDGNVGAIHLADRILGLTYHFLGNQPIARKLTERALRKAHHLDSSLGLGYQVETPVAMAAQLARILWVQGFPDQAMAMSAKALTAALEVGHPQATFYALAYAGVPVALWVGDLAEANHRTERLIALTTGNPRTEQWGRVLAGVIELRKEGSERGALITSFVEPRVDLFSTMPLARMLSDRNIPDPAPEPEPAEVLWNTPELLRVDAELLLWHDLPGAAVTAEAKLLRALEIARAQAALSWELRTAMSLAQLMLNREQSERAKQLLAPVFRRFTEGFDTADLKAAKGLLEQLP
jgi:predicted ATPase/DNA-binding winged helix-turn-helix (wHTH) protein